MARALKRPTLKNIPVRLPSRLPSRLPAIPKLPDPSEPDEFCELRRRMKYIR